MTSLSRRRLLSLPVDVQIAKSFPSRPSGKMSHGWLKQCRRNWNMSGRLDASNIVQKQQSNENLGLTRCLQTSSAFLKRTNSSVAGFSLEGCIFSLAASDLFKNLRAVSGIACVACFTVIACNFKSAQQSSSGFLSWKLHKDCSHSVSFSDCYPWRKTKSPTSKRRNSEWCTFCVFSETNAESTNFRAEVELQAEQIGSAGDAIKEAGATPNCWCS